MVSPVMFLVTPAHHLRTARPTAHRLHRNCFPGTGSIHRYLSDSASMTQQNTAMPARHPNTRLADGLAKQSSTTQSSSAGCRLTIRAKISGIAAHLAQIVMSTPSQLGHTNPNCSNPEPKIEGGRPDRGGSRPDSAKQAMGSRNLQ